MAEKEENLGMPECDQNLGLKGYFLILLARCLVGVRQNSFPLPLYLSAIEIKSLGLLLLARWMKCVDNQAEGRSLRELFRRITTSACADSAAGADPMIAK